MKKTCLGLLLLALPSVLLAAPPKPGPAATPGPREPRVLVLINSAESSLPAPGPTSQQCVLVMQELKEAATAYLGNTRIGDCKALQQLQTVRLRLTSGSAKMGCNNSKVVPDVNQAITFLE